MGAMRRTTTTTTTGGAARQKRAYAATGAVVIPYKRRAGPSRAMLPYSSGARVQAALMGRPRGPLAQEIKSFDAVPIAIGALGGVGAVAGAEPAAFTSLTEVNCIQQGATVANRIGNKVIMRSIHLRMHMSSPAAVVGQARLMLVYDRQPNGAFPAITDILLSQPAGVAASYSGINIANKSRFLMLRDHFYIFDAAQSLVHMVDLYCKGRWEAEFGANAGTIGDFRTGAVYLVVYATFVGGGNISTSAAQCRIRYYD